MLEALSTISSLASIASLAVQLGIPLSADGRPDIAGALDALKQRLTAPQKRSLELPGAEEIVSLLIIDQDLLDVIEASIRDCIKRYKAAITKAKRQAEQEAVDRQAERCVCAALNRIKRRNGGTLPPGPFFNWWLSYQCVDDHDY